MANQGEAPAMPPIPSLAEIKLILLLGGGVLIAVASAYITHQIGTAQLDALKLQDAQAQVAAVTKAKNDQVALDQATNDATQRELDAQRSITADVQKRLAAVAREVPAGRGGCITWGFLRAIDASALQVSPESLAFPDGATAEKCASKITAAALASNIIGNYSAAQHNAERDQAWQSWAKDIAAVKR